MTEKQPAEVNDAAWVGCSIAAASVSVAAYRGLAENTYATCETCTERSDYGLFGPVSGSQALEVLTGARPLWNTGCPFRTKLAGKLLIRDIGDPEDAL